MSNWLTTNFARANRETSIHPLNPPPYHPPLRREYCVWAPSVFVRKTVFIFVRIRIGRGTGLYYRMYDIIFFVNFFFIYCFVLRGLERGRFRGERIRRLTRRILSGPIREVRLNCVRVTGHLSHRQSVGVFFLVFSISLLPHDIIFFFTPYEQYE